LKIIARFLLENLDVDVRRTKQTLQTKLVRELDNQEADNTNQLEGLEPHLFYFSSSAFPCQPFWLWGDAWVACRAIGRDNRVEEEMGRRL
jgi:hypothetical protein